MYRGLRGHDLQRRFQAASTQGVHHHLHAVQLRFCHCKHHPTCWQAHWQVSKWAMIN
jgi:hypothetical protein